MAITGCGDQTQNIRNAAAGVAGGPPGITDAGLARCVRNRAQDPDIECVACEDPATLAYNEWFTIFGIKIFASSKIFVCLNNLTPANVPDLGMILTHEWAHSCCWDHNEGQGVPYADGSYP